MQYSCTAILQPAASRLIFADSLTERCNKRLLISGHPGGFRPVHAEDRTSSLEDRGWNLLALGGPPRRHGWTQLETLVRLDPGKGPGSAFERIAGVSRAKCSARPTDAFSGAARKS